MTTGTLNNTMWLEPSATDPKVYEQVYPCRCGQAHTDKETFDVHQALAPPQSKIAAQIRDILRKHLDDGMQDPNAFRLEVVTATNVYQHATDEEANQLWGAIEWLFLDRQREHKIPKDVAWKALLRNLRLLTEPPTLRWTYPGATYEPGEFSL